MTQFRFQRERATDREIRVEILLADDRAVPGELISADVAGASATFPAERSPALCLAQTVRLRFSCSTGRGDVVLAARTRTRCEHEGTREYHFLFRDKEAVERQLFPWLRPLLDRRGVVRVRPPSTRAVEVRLDAPSLCRPVVGVLADLSEAGLALLVTQESEEALSAVERVRARCVLPGRPPAEVDVEARIVIRRLAGTRVQLGLAFLPDATPDFLRQEQTIRRFVIECQTRTLGRTG